MMSGCHVPMDDQMSRLWQHNRVTDEMYSYMRLEIDRLKSKVESLENFIGTMAHTVKAAETAESLFASKVHDLKSIDKKRDDVIDALCQKVELLNKRVMDLMID